MATELQITRNMYEKKLNKRGSEFSNIKNIGTLMRKERPEQFEAEYKSYLRQVII